MPSLFLAIIFLLLGLQLALLVGLVILVKTVVMQVVKWEKGIEGRIIGEQSRVVEFAQEVVNQYTSLSVGVMPGKSFGGGEEIPKMSEGGRGVSFIDAGLTEDTGMGNIPEEERQPFPDVEDDPWLNALEDGSWG